jgi:hypothetical protein
MAIQVSGCTVIDNSRNLVNTNISSGSFIKGLGPGIIIEGGTLICKSSSVAWIVSPCTSQVSRTYANIGDSNTRAQQVSGCTGWFVPLAAQLQNPGYACRLYWDSYSSSYWASDPSNVIIPGGEGAIAVSFNTGNTSNSLKTDTLPVRSFRCVSY